MKTDDIIVREVDDGAVLLHLGNGTYYGLDPLGLKFWNLLQQGNSVSEIVSLIATDYDVDPERMERDFIALHEDLKSNGLLQ